VVRLQEAVLNFDRCQRSVADLGDKVTTKWFERRLEEADLGFFKQELAVRRRACGSP
jgi:hypothetical protein